MKVYLSIGGNLGQRESNLENALKALVQKVGKPVAVSPVYETEPVGFTSDDKFLNMVVILETAFDPFEILDQISIIESSLGRKRGPDKNVSRQIDIDIIFYDDLIVRNERLTIPHPRMHERNFVLAPFCDIEPDFIHPVLHRSIRELFKDSGDKSIVYPPPRGIIGGLD